MPRRREIPERVTTPDSKYDSVLVAKFVNCIMRDGKKSVAESTLYQALDALGKKTNEPPLKMFEQAVDNVRPLIEVKSRRVGGSTYQVPTEIRPSRRTALGIRWLITYARQRPEKGMANKLAAELLDAANRRGASVKKKRKTPIKWPKPTRLLPIFAGRQKPNSLWAQCIAIDGIDGMLGDAHTCLIGRMRRCRRRSLSEPSRM
jgi:small subunit ribosomal protein S7